MSEELTRAIAEQMGCSERIGQKCPVHKRRIHFASDPNDKRGLCPAAREAAAAVAPLMEARVRDAQADVLESEADRMEAHARRQIALPSNGNKARQKARDKQRGHNAGAVLTAARELRKKAEEVRNGRR